MKKVKITVMRIACYDDLIEKYENPIEPCEMRVGMTFVSVGGERPEGFCNNAWRSVGPYAKTLAEGGGNFFDGWMKNEYSAMGSCDDGFRPVSYLVEALPENDDN